MRSLLLLLVVLAGTTACAGPVAGPGRQPVSSAPATLLADGSVPWADLRITDEEFNGPPARPRTAAAGSEPCRAEQLSGRLTTWTRPGFGGEKPRGMDAAIGRLIGEVDVRNTSDVECTLRGEVPTTMFAGSNQIPMVYTHGVDAAAAARVVAVPAGEHAGLRLDWSGPFCQPADGPRELAIEIPDDGGTLRAPITAGDSPGCQQGEGINPNARAALSAGAFSEPVVVSKPPRSPLDRLTVVVIGPSTAAAGSRSRFRVTLGNPTGRPLGLDPCPGYLMEHFSLGDATDDAVNRSQLYRLNCGPIRQIPARSTAAFEMVADVPAGMRSGRTLTITWKLYLPHYGQRANQYGTVTLRIT